MQQCVLPALALLLLSTGQSVPQQPEPAAERTPPLADWEALRYGMFIHFGMSTYTGHEFGGIPATSAEFAPTALDVDQWIRVAKEAGMKYAVLTTKHCYGHALWPTKESEYSVATSAAPVDVVRQFVDACRKHGLEPGFYYLLGWDQVNQARMTPPEYERFCRRQVTELLTGYGPILEMWFDIPWDMGPESRRVLADLYALVKEKQPDCLVLLNQGFADGAEVVARGPTYRGEAAGDEPVLLWPKDLIDGEVTLPPSGGHDPWMKVEGRTYYIPMETCDTLARHWFFLDHDALNTVPTLYGLYRGCLDRRANLLLDVAPDRTGRIPAGAVRRLMELARVIDDPAALPLNLLHGKAAIASNVYRDDPAYGPDKLTDGDSRTRWATDDAVTAAWVEFDLGADTAFDSAVVTEGWNRVEEFAIEVPDGEGGWTAVHRGGKIGGDGALLRFPAVTARRVRLAIQRATVGPTIWDFEVYRGARN
ncbi:MAG: alpha-L-fucosidase [Planctomycetota bacterium]